MSCQCIDKESSFFLHQNLPKPKILLNNHNPSNGCVVFNFVFKLKSFIQYDKIYKLTKMFQPVANKTILEHGRNEYLYRIHTPNALAFHLKIK